MPQVRPNSKAWLVTLFFAVLGVIGAVMFVVDWFAAAPLLLFYIVITVNTFPSVRLFSSITPDSKEQIAADFALVLLYGFLAFSFADPVRFAICDALLFIVAAMKYTRMLGVVPHPVLLKRKITVDLMGAFLGVGVIAVMFAGHIALGAWMLGGIFFMANVYFLGINPMYRFD